MSNTPTQERSIDPFSSYASDITNTLSRGTTRNNNGLLGISDLVCSITDTTGIITVSPGFIYVSDVLIQITANHVVDFNDGLNYVNVGATQYGYHYIVLEYVFQKSRPAPTAKIKILRPLEDKSNVGTSLIFLQAVQISAGTPSIKIDSIHDYDPSDSSYTRQYVDLDISGIFRMPDEHDPTRDRGRVLYEVSRNKYWFGYEDRWEEITAGASITIDTDSTALLKGMVAYVDSNGKAQPASLATGDIETRAEFVVLELGTSTTGNGRGRIAGVVDEVLVEELDGTAFTIITAGDVVYLSSTDDGRVTNVRPSGTYQVLGKALTSGNSSISMLFIPGDIIFTAISGTINAVTDWSGSGPYYYDIDITKLNIQHSAVLVDTWKNNLLYSVNQVEIMNAGNTVRITETVNSNTVDYIITDGAGGGASSGGGGAVAHSLLSNLDYASSGHTGFAPTPHNNTHHSDTYITVSSVNYTNLNANGSVGSGAAQVAIGNHTHTVYNDVPAGTTLLFESNVAISGYTLLTTVNDAVVYITSGTVAGGQSGGAYKSGGTWTQPSHTLTAAQVPYHTHTITYAGVSLSAVAELIGGPTPRTMAEFTGGIGTPATVSGFGSGGSHNHGSSWRPYGFTFTRQRRI